MCMKTRKILLILIAGLSFFTSCKEKSDIEALPPATQVGANTFGCLINGKVYKCSGFLDPGDIFNLLSEGCYFYYDKEEVTLQARIKEPKDNILIEFPNPKHLGTNTITEGIRYRTQEVDTDYDSKIVITRFGGGIISGTFQLKVTYDDGSTELITNGRFDFKNEE